MTVKQLIEALENMQPDLEVYYREILIVNVEGGIVHGQLGIKLS